MSTANGTIKEMVAMRYAVQNPNSRSKNVAGMEESEAMFVNLPLSG
jgi:hypothetical protein